MLPLLSLCSLCSSHWLSCKFSNMLKLSLKHFFWLFYFWQKLSYEIWLCPPSTSSVSTSQWNQTNWKVGVGAERNSFTEPYKGMGGSCPQTQTPWRVSVSVFKARWRTCRTRDQLVHKSLTDGCGWGNKAVSQGLTLWILGYQKA